MIFSMYEQLPEKKREYYEDMLSSMGSLSRLFSENNTPYLDYRVAENLFCKAFNAENKSRDDSSFDATLNGFGIGIKTFLGASPQKVAEFNRDLLSYTGLSPLEKAKKIAELRNYRIDFAKRNYGTDKLIYHCVFREKGKMKILESPMQTINISKIKLLKEGVESKSVQFTDGKESYLFNLSKSVLLKKFNTDNPFTTVQVDIIEDPFDQIYSIFGKKAKRKLGEVAPAENPKVILPLYSIRENQKIVPEKSGLNQWNAGGRARDADEIYIPIPAWIHQAFPGFFPSRDISFELKLPNGTNLDAKVCQDNNKALMSKHNKDLGAWLLRKVLLLPPKRLVSFELLKKAGVDSVVVEKIGEKKYKIDFSSLGTYEEFVQENKKRLASVDQA